MIKQGFGFGLAFYRYIECVAVVLKLGLVGDSASKDPCDSGGSYQISTQKITNPRSSLIIMPFE